MLFWLLVLLLTVAMSGCVALIGRKVGMLGTYDDLGRVLPVTVIQVEKNVLLGAKAAEVDGYNAVVVAGFESSKKGSVNKPQASIFQKVGLPLFSKVKEFRTPFSPLGFSGSVGSSFGVSLDMKGMFLDIQGVAAGKGFQGPMKRWGFRGLRATHGVSVSHRSHGSTGNRTDPGKVWKGKKMAGRMGGGVVVQQNVLVLDVDIDEGLLFLRGSIPGRNGGVLFVRDAVRKRSRGDSIPSLNGLVAGVSSGVVSHAEVPSGSVSVGN